MEARKMLAMISDPIEKWHQKNSNADIHTLCVDEDGQKGGVLIHIGYSKPRGNELDFFETPIQVSRNGEVTIKKPRRV